MPQNNIILRLQGGLGNQMFQYAAGYALSKRFNANLRVDVSLFHRAHIDCTPRRYELAQYFDIETPAWIFPRTSSWMHRLFVCAQAQSHTSPKGIFLQKVAGKCLELAFKTYLKQNNYRRFTEPHNDYTSVWETLSEGNIYLDGYWESEKYFKTVESDVRRMFALSRFASHQTQSFAKEVSCTHSVSVHFRRGDYHRDKLLLSIDYYQRAKALLQALVPKELKFYIFSDDMKDIPRQYLSVFTNHVAISGRGLSAHEEMYLMSSCHHHIMANSSYSWWSVWLDDPKSEKRMGAKYVFAPRAWRYDNPKDLHIDGWIMV